jgi:hypothetical protein
MRLTPTRGLLTLASLLLAGVIGYVLFVLSDPVGAFENTGPFTGRVVDAETKQPIKNAYVLVGWAGTTFIDGGGCVGGTIGRTDEQGRFYIPWQGKNVKWFLHGSIARGALNVWAVDYRPWAIQQDAPRETDGTTASLPTGTPFVVKDVGVVTLTPEPQEDYSNQPESRRPSNCAETRWFEETQEYLSYRSNWKRLCGGSARPGSSADLAHLNRWIAKLPLLEPSKNDTRQQYGNRSGAVDPRMVAAYKQRSEKIDEVDLLIHAPHEAPPRLKTPEELTLSDWQHACMLLDFRIAGIQE